MMISRERVLAVLNGNIPDRVPWIENYVSNEVTAGLLGHNNFIKNTYSYKIEFPGMIRVSPDVSKAIPLDNISYDLAPPRFAETELLGGHENITKGLLLTRDDLGLLDALPDPDDNALYRPAEKFLVRYKGDLAAICSVRSGPSNTYLSMGIDQFCQSIISDPELVRGILWRFSNWTRRVVRNVQELPFDLFFMPDDIGFGAAPMISPQHFREFCVPAMKNVVDEMNLPVIYHSDGNIMPLMDDIISLGVSGVANMEPGPMNIFEVKKLFGEKITLVGNIDLHYTLPRGTQEETRQEVKEKILRLAPGGRYILASANSLANYVKPENARAIGEALLTFGCYGKGALKELKQDSARPDNAGRSAPAQGQAAEYIISTTSSEPHLQTIQNVIIQQKQGEIADLVKEALAAGLEPQDIINEALIKAMDVVGQKFSTSEIFLPEMLSSAITMKTGLDVLKPLLQDGPSQSQGKMMLATVKGDLHDIGKNIVSMMMEGGGFEVMDLGINVDTAEIIENVKEHKPDILGLSALLTSTMPEMGNVIKRLEEAGCRHDLAVLIGGAPVSQAFCDEIGADGYALDAAEGVKLARKGLELINF